MKSASRKIFSTMSADVEQGAIKSGSQIHPKVHVPDSIAEDTGEREVETGTRTHLRETVVDVEWLRYASTREDLPSHVFVKLAYEVYKPVCSYETWTG